MNYKRLKQSLDLARSIEDRTPDCLYEEIAICHAAEAENLLHGGEHDTAKPMLELARVNAALASAQALSGIAVSLQEISEHLRSRP